MAKGIYQLDHHFFASVNAGLVSGVSTASMAGYNPNLTGGVEENLWPFGGVYVWPNSSGEPMELVSDNVLDVFIPVLIQGLGEDGLMLQDVVLLNGTNPTGTNLIFSRINFLLVLGGSETQGIVRLQGAGGGPTYSGIMPADQQSLQLIHTIPANKQGFFLPAESTINKSGGSNDNVILGTRVRQLGGVFWRAGRWGLQKNGASCFLFETAEAPSLSPRLDVMITGMASSTGVDVSGRVPFLLFDIL